MVHWKMYLCYCKIYLGAQLITRHAHSFSGLLVGETLFLIIGLFTDITVFSLIFFSPTTHPNHVGQQASRESLPSSLSGNVSEVGLSSTQGALGAPVVPQPSGSPAAAPAPVPATPSKVGR